MNMTSKPQYRKTNQGEWVVFGPARAIKPGTVSVTTKAGVVKTETVVRVGKTFRADGVECAYGYLAPAKKTSGKKTCITGGNCSSFGSGMSCGAHDCDGWES